MLRKTQSHNRGFVERNEPFPEINENTPIVSDGAREQFIILREELRQKALALKLKSARDALLTEKKAHLREFAKKYFGKDVFGGLNPDQQRAFEAMCFDTSRKSLRKRIALLATVFGGVFISQILLGVPVWLCLALWALFLPFVSLNRCKSYSCGYYGRFGNYSCDMTHHIRREFRLLMVENKLKQIESHKQTEANN